MKYTCTRFIQELPTAYGVSGTGKGARVTAIELSITFLREAQQLPEVVLIFKNY